MSDNISENREPESPFQREAAEKANKELGHVKGLLSSVKAGIPVLNKYEESEVNRDNSFKDPMTGLLNRRGLLEEYKLALETRERVGVPTSNVLIALDLIGLKKLNEELTEPGADKVIKEASVYLKSQIRTTDLASRWGGDEFLIVLFGNNEETAKNKIGEILNNLPERVHFNVGYKVIGLNSDPEPAVNDVMGHMDEIKHMGPTDSTGRATGNGIVVNVDNIKK